EPPRAPEIDDHLEFRWCLHGKIGWLLTFENSIHIGCAAPKQIDRIDSIRHQAAVSRVESKRIHGGQAAAGRRSNNPISLDRVESGRDHNQAAFRLLRKRGNSRFAIVGWSLEMKNVDIEPKSGRHVFNRAPYAGKSFKARVQNAHYPAETGRDLFEQLQPFAADFRLECAEPGNVASREGQTLHVTGADWVDDRDEYDWDRA